MNYRIRLEGDLLVLQILVEAPYSPYESERTASWRDATIHDIPIADPFAAPQSNWGAVTQMGGAIAGHRHEGR